MNRPEDPQTLFPMPDMQSAADDRRLAIDQVGIKGIRYPLSFADADGVARPTVAVVWPPNHGMVVVGITGVSDPNNNATITTTGVTQDEPTIGLHARDTDTLAGILRDLANHGNTVVVVEHDPSMIQAADHIVEMGPG